ncbi:M20/M25/M40 family metallo-hydrolase [Pseudonocardia acaciae]|uniref:M20/M25/M40 family metallo-hydrolase n=1 Tax=Pseudonocardia acaciae TaxID=551276 RepID=UPI000490F822|nr:M20/M25/M40 family metallo-hydrolase [Pseudonocardia acaciae]
MMRTASVIACIAVVLLSGCGSAAPPPSAPPPATPTDQAAFRDLYKELVETNTSASAGDCTLAAQRMAARLKKAGYPDGDLNVFVPPDHPKDGGLIATLHGTDPASKPILLLAHIDVVEAKQEDWGRDPFKLVEENGYFTARGAVDDKSMAAIWVDSLIRYRAENFRPKHDIKIALTCGEEGGAQVNGAEWLVKNHRDWIDAAFALNEGAAGTLDEQNNRVSLDIQAGEKVYQNFTLRTTDPGGHSSRPGPFNAIGALGGALARISAFNFPTQVNDVTRASFERRGALTPGPMGQAMKALAANPNDAAAAATLSADPVFNATLRTTCVPTQIQGGHARNALPQQAEANVNCRIFPGTPGADVQKTLTDVINDPKITIQPVEPFTSAAPVPPLSDTILRPATEVAAKMWPGVPLIPTQSTGATDGRYLNEGGIPTYGLSGRFYRTGDDHTHGLNERILARSLYESRDYLYEVTKLYANS